MRHRERETTKGIGNNASSAVCAAASQASLLSVLYLQKSAAGTSRAARKTLFVCFCFLNVVCAFQLVVK